MARKQDFEYTIEEIRPDSWDMPKLRGLLARFRGKKILLIGDVGLDRYTVGSVERISQEAPVPILRVEKEQLKLGLTANQADNVRALGGRPQLCGIVGKDRGAEDFRTLLDSEGINTRLLITDRARRTTVKERIVTEQQQVVRVDYESLEDVSDETRSRLLAKVSQTTPAVDAVILGDYGKGLVDRTFVAHVCEIVRKHGKLVAVDPKFKDAETYRGAHVITPNTTEAEHMGRIRIRDDASLAECGVRILEASRSHHVIITRGKEGMAIFTRGSRRIHLIPTYAREVFDVSGAGDTVIAVMALALSADASIQEACILGNLAAGVEVGKKGTATVSPEEVLVAMEFFAQTAQG